MPAKNEFRGVSGLCHCLRLLAIAAAVQSGNARRAVGQASATCDEPGRLYLPVAAGLNADGRGSALFAVQGNLGAHDFVFASGTTAPDIAAAVNSFAAATGVRAHADDCATPDYVYVYSERVGAAQFVSVEQIGGDRGVVCQFGPYPCGFVATDFGVDGITGDVTCDGAVDHLDLAAVVDRWEACYDMWCMPQRGSCDADANNDLQVSVDDLLSVINHWGEGGSSLK